MIEQLAQLVNWLLGDIELNNDIGCDYSPLK